MPEKTTKQKKLNPEVVDIHVGVRHLRKVTFYPLSAAQQLKMTSIIEEVFGQMVSVEDGNDDTTMAFFKNVLDIVKENINIIIEMITDDEPDKLLGDMTNSQLVEVVKYVYETNYEGPLKNLLSLFQKEGDTDWKELVLNQLSPQSVKSTDTSSQTSTKKDSKKAVLRKDK
jgi:F0F1-type ATP synthase delta subunit